ncbi:MAG: SpoIIE family protein phosphatase [Paramuribaculum sp.]|nr:SpoIIE family protein phosphatase [Paramuribaculum sp.]
MKPTFRLRTALKAQGLAIIIIAAALLVVSSTIQLRFQRNELIESVELRARNEITAKSGAIEELMSAVESAVSNHLWNASRLLAYPDSMFSVTEKIVAQNPNVVGSAVSFIPNYYASKGPLFEPYAVRDKYGEITTMQLASDSHDYTNMDFFKTTIARDSARWSEPYLDSDGAGMMLTTFTAPLHDSNGKLVGVLDADVALSGISELMKKGHYFPSTYSFLISPGKEILSWSSDTTESDVDSTLLAELTAIINESDFRSGEDPLSQKEITDADGKRNIAYFSPLNGHEEWTVALVYSHDDMYREYRRMRVFMLILWGGGVLLLLCILLLSVRNISRLQTVTERDERRGGELKIARDIQMGMIPQITDNTATDERVKISGIIEPAKEVGGDLYDFFFRGDLLCFCIGDVSGKGVPAALLMSMIRSFFHTAAHSYDSADKVISVINEGLLDFDHSSMFATMFVGILDLNSGHLQYCNAGHNPPLLVGHDVVPLKVEINLPVGVINNFTYRQGEHTLKPGETLLLYTDGVTEAKNKSGELFGENRLVNALRASDETLPDRLLMSVTTSLDDFVAGAEQADDITLLAIGLTPEGRKSIVVNCRIESLQEVENFVSSLIAGENVDPSVVMQIRLLVEEVFVNIVNYAYDTPGEGNVKVEGTVANAVLRLVFSDTGRMFDPTSAPSPDILLSADERDIGGLGIMLVREMADSMSYRYLNGCNKLEIIKKLK